MDNQVENNFVYVNKIKLHYIKSGKGEPILLLHGFPDFWYTWRYQIPVFAKSYKVIAPDLRGYNKSDKPERLEAYSTSNLVQDILELIKKINEKKITVIGHDWGGAIAWYIAMMNPELIKNLIIINSPHPVMLLKKFWALDVKQFQKSWYVFFFQLHGIPENVLSRDNYSMLKMMLRRSTADETVFNDLAMQKYIDAWSQPGALTASINYYRVNWNIARILSMTKEQQNELLQGFTKIKCPTLVIWGEKDIALDKSLTIGLEELVEGKFQLQIFPNYGHWVHLEASNLVNTSILNFLQNI